MYRIFWVCASADLVADLLGTCIHLCTDASLGQLVQNFLAVICVFVRDRKNLLPVPVPARLGNAPAKCSIKIPMKRSMEPNTTR